MEVRKGERKIRKEKKEVNEGETSLPRVPRRKNIPNIENFPKHRNSKQHSRDCHIEYSTIGLSPNTQLELAEYELLRDSYVIPQHPRLLNKP